MVSCGKQSKGQADTWKLTPSSAPSSCTVAIVYGTLYLFFTAYPIVFQSPKPYGYGWGPGVGGLAFIGVGIGMFIGTCLTPISDRIYRKAAKNSPTGRAPPEARLPMACVGAVLLPVGLFCECCVHISGGQS
jgi:hypothetical protein